MNIQVFIVGCITAFAFFTHLFVGTKESLSISPTKLDPKIDEEKSASLMKNWTQSMCAFQMISVDLLFLSILLFIISMSDIIVFEHSLTLALSVLYLFWGLAWLIQLLALKSNPKNYFHLGQWIFWFFCSGLLYWGS